MRFSFERVLRLALISAPLVLLFAGCAREIIDLQDNAFDGRGIVFSASYDPEDAETRTQMDAEQKHILWSAGDKISVFDSDEMGYEYTASGAGSSASFTLTDEDSPSDTDFWYALYPYDEDSDLSDGVFTTTLRDEYTVDRAGSFNDEMNISVAKSSSMSLSFKNVLAWLKVASDGLGDDVVKIEMRGNKDEVLAGQIEIDYTGTVPVATLAEGNGSKVMTINVENYVTSANLPKEDRVFFYIPVLPQTFEDGFTLTFYSESGKIGKFVYDTEVTFIRNKRNGMFAAITPLNGLVDPCLTSMWKYTKSGQSANMQVTLNRLLNSSISQYNFLDFQNLSPAEIAANDYSNASLVKLIHPGSSDNKIGVPTPVKINEMLSASQASSLRSAITSAETVSGEYDDNVRDAILSWWIENALDIYYQQVIDAYYTAACIKSYGCSYGCDIGIYDSTGTVRYPIDDRDSGLISYNTKIRFICKESETNSPFYNDANTNVYLISWKSIAIILYNTYYLKDIIPAEIPVSGVNLNCSALSLELGSTDSLIATIVPSDAANQAVTWSSSNSSVAAVGPQGTVTAVAPGTATITVTTADGGYTATCEVTVKKPFPEGTTFDEDAYITYVANHQEWLSLNTDTSYGYDTQFGADVSGTRVEMKFQVLEYSSQKAILSYGSHKGLAIDASNVYQVRFERRNSSGDTWYNQEFDAGVESGIEGTGTVVLTASCDGNQISASVNGNETTIPVSASSFDFEYLFSYYDYEGGDGTKHEYLAGVPIGTKLYYVKIWNGDELVYFGHASKSVYSYSSEEEFCWYEEIGNKFTFARTLRNLNSSEITPYNPASPIATSRKPFGGGID